MSNPKKIAVMVSGSGSNLQAIMDHPLLQQKLELCGVISNQPEALALNRARDRGIEGIFFSSKKLEYEPLILKQLGEWQVDLVVLAGFMRVLSQDFIERCPAPLINLHPSLLPAYKGLNTHGRVIESGDRLHGCSVHAVTPELDDGQLLSQSLLAVSSSDTAQTLQSRVQSLEHRLLCDVLIQFAHDRLSFTQDHWQLDGGHTSLPIRFYDPA